MWLRNIQLAGFSIAIGLVQLMALTGLGHNNLAHTGVMHGFGPKVSACRRRETRRRRGPCVVGIVTV